MLAHPPRLKRSGADDRKHRKDTMNSIDLRDLLDLFDHDFDVHIHISFRQHEKKHHRRQAVKILFFDENHKEISMLKMTDVQKAKASISFVDAKGHPAIVDGVPVWDVSNAGPVSLAPAADGMSCDIVANAPGTLQVNVTADADLGAGTKTITGVLDVEITGSDAVTVNINVGPVEDQ
jgi:hypothetical protein